MTTDNEHIKAEIAAEVKRIQAWNEPRLRDDDGTWLRPASIQSLANHLVRNRMQVGAAKDAQHKRLVAALRDAQYQIHVTHPKRHSEHQDMELCTWKACQDVRATLGAEEKP